MGGRYRYPGRGRHYNGRSVAHKMPVGMVQRKGRVVAVAVRSAKHETLMPPIEERVRQRRPSSGTNTRVYNSLAGDRKVEHRRVPPAERIYAMGKVHTNTIEGF